MAAVWEAISSTEANGGQVITRTVAYLAKVSTAPKAYITFLPTTVFFVLLATLAVAVVAFSHLAMGHTFFAVLNCSILPHSAPTCTSTRYANLGPLEADTARLHGEDETWKIQILAAGCA